VLGRQCSQALSVFLSCARYPPILTQKSADKPLGMSQTTGMGQPLSQRARFITSLEGLIGVAELPQSRCSACPAPLPTKRAATPPANLYKMREKRQRDLFDATRP
jgi:hypothetical protein